MNINPLVWACLLGMVVGAGLFYLGLRTGRSMERDARDAAELERRLRDQDPDDTAGRLPSDAVTEEFPAVVDEDGDAKRAELGPQESPVGQPVQLSVGQDSGRHFRKPGEPRPAWLPELPGTEQFVPVVKEGPPPFDVYLPPVKAVT